MLEISVLSNRPEAGKQRKNFLICKETGRQMNNACENNLLNWLVMLFCIFVSECLMAPKNASCQI
jgi:hypothetical protein